MALSGPDLLSRVRKYIDDAVVPYNTEDALLYDFLTEAERELALNGRLIRKVLKLRTVADSAWVLLPEAPEIIEFRRAEILDGTNRHPLRLQGTMDTFQHSSADYGQLLPVNSNLRARPATLVLGQDTDRIMAYPTPAEVYTIEVSAIIYPEEPITASTEQVSIPTRHQAAVAIGASVRAIEADPFFDNNSNKLQSLAAAWQQALVRAAQETGAISREASPVQFSNDYW